VRAGIGNLLCDRYDYGYLHCNRHERKHRDVYIHCYGNTLYDHLSGEHNDVEYNRSVLGYSELQCADDDWLMRHGDVHAGLGFVVPSWHHYRELYDRGGTNLFVYRHGERHATAYDYVSTKSDAWNGYWAVLSGSELPGTDCIRQLSGREFGLRTAGGVYLPEGRNNGDVYGHRCGGANRDVQLHGYGERHASAYDNVSGKHHSVDRFGSVFGSGDLCGAGGE